MKRWQRALLIPATVLVAGCGRAGPFLLRPEPVSVELGERYFHDRSLGSPYTTGIPYALWLAIMERYPEEFGRDWNELRDKFGLLANLDTGNELPVGFTLEDDALTGTRFLATSCALCHTAEIGRQRIVGLGARNLRVNALNDTLMEIAARGDFNVQLMIKTAEETARKRKMPWDWRSRVVTKKAVQRLKELSARHVKLDAGPGRNTPIEFAKARVGAPVKPPIGYVRFPPVWTYTKRQTFGWDGSMKGDLALAGASVKFNEGMPPGYIVRHKERWQSIYEYLKTVKAPVYPGHIDSTLAERGRKIFAANCASCHGTYGPAGSYQEQVVPLAQVGTDPDRLRSLTPELAEARNRTAFGKLVPLEPSAGYVAPPLDGIWARGPYLHNGAVPTLDDLLRPARERPASFFIGEGTGYDLDRLGVAYQEETLPDGIRRGRRASPRQFEFDTREPGNSNAGHEFGTDLSPEERKSLIEYLKQL